MSGEYANKVVLSLIAQTCQYVGWTAATKSSLDIFSDIFERYVTNFGKSLKGHAELGNRSLPLLEDISLTFKTLGISIHELNEYIEDVPPFPSVRDVPIFPLSKPNDLRIPDINDLKEELRPDYIPDFYPLLNSKNYLSKKEPDHVGSRELGNNEVGLQQEEEIKNVSMTHKVEVERFKQMPQNTLFKNKHMLSMGLTNESKSITAVKKMPINTFWQKLSSSSSSEEVEDEVEENYEKIKVEEDSQSFDLATNKLMSPFKSTSKHHSLTPSKRKVGRPKKQDSESPIKNSLLLEGIISSDETNNIKTEKGNLSKLDATNINDQSNGISENKMKSIEVTVKKTDGKKKFSKEKSFTTPAPTREAKQSINKYKSLENELFSLPLILPKLKLKEPYPLETIKTEYDFQMTPVDTTRTKKKGSSKISPKFRLSKKEIQQIGIKDKQEGYNFVAEKKAHPSPLKKITPIKSESHLLTTETDSLFAIDKGERKRGLLAQRDACAKTSNFSTNPSTRQSSPFNGPAFSPRGTGDLPSPLSSDPTSKASAEAPLKGALLNVVGRGKKKKSLGGRKVKKAGSFKKKTKPIPITIVDYGPTAEEPPSWDLDVPVACTEETVYQESTRPDEDDSFTCPFTPTLTDAKENSPIKSYLGLEGSPKRLLRGGEESSSASLVLSDVAADVTVTSPVPVKESTQDTGPSDDSEKAPSTPISDGLSDASNHAIKYEITTTTPSYSATRIVGPSDPGRNDHVTDHHVTGDETAARGPIRIKISKRSIAPPAPPQPPPAPLSRPPIYTPSASSEEEGDVIAAPVVAPKATRDLMPKPITIEGPAPVPGYGLSNFIDHVTDADLFRRSAAAAASMTSSSSSFGGDSPRSGSLTSCDSRRLDDVSLLRRRKMTKGATGRTPLSTPNAPSPGLQGKNQKIPTGSGSSTPKKSKLVGGNKKRKRSLVMPPLPLAEESLEYIPSKKRRKSTDSEGLPPYDYTLDFTAHGSRPSSLPPLPSVKSLDDKAAVLPQIHSSEKMAVSAKSPGGKRSKKLGLLSSPQTLPTSAVTPNPKSATPGAKPSKPPVTLLTSTSLLGGVQRTVITETLGSAVVSDNGEKIWICPACTHPDDGSPMIGCDTCDDWYHWICVNITEPPDENENWYCSRCLAKRLTSKKKKRKKR